MLKKIAVEDARVGMFLHRLEGAWMDHPFWKTQFKLTEPEDLRKLQASAVRHCWIDVAKGLDVVPPEALAAGPAPTAPATPLTPVASAPPVPAPAPPEPRLSMKEELREAAAVCGRAGVAMASMLREARLGNAVDAEACLPLVEDISRSVLRNPGALVSLARLKTADDYSYMHSVAVCALMVALGRQLGLDEAACREAGMAGLLHDMGKAAMPLEVLNKPGRLTEAEYDIMKTHPERGHTMLLEAKGAPEAALEVCLHHHERPDGRGYPHGLSGDSLSMLARMGAVCDVYDAVTSNRPYKAGWDPAESIAQMVSWKGQFDGPILRAFVRSLGIYPTGSLVRMASGKLGVVMEQNPASLVSPVVKLFVSTKSMMPITAVRVDLSRPGCSDRIVGRESASQWNFPSLDELWLEGQAPRTR